MIVKISTKQNVIFWLPTKTTLQKKAAFGHMGFFSETSWKEKVGHNSVEPHMAAAGNCTTIMCSLTPLVDVTELCDGALPGKTLIITVHSMWYKYVTEI